MIALQSAGRGVKKAFANPWARLAGRATVAAIIAAVTMIHTAGGTVAWHAVAVGAGLAFCEVFTPLNVIVGVFKTIGISPR